MQLLFEMGRMNHIRHVLCLQENTVAGAADGYARMAGKPAFTLLHAGSGFANAIANIHNAGRANLPMINVVGASATYHQNNFPEPELINGKIIDLARVVSHWAQEARSATDLAVLGTLATRCARMGAGKICTIVAPSNYSCDRAAASDKFAEPSATLKPSSEAIQAVAALLMNGKRSALLLGSHVLHGDGLELAGRIAASTGVDLLMDGFPARLARGAGRVPVQRIPYFAEAALRFMEPYEQLILVGAFPPVVTYAHKGMPVLKAPENCETVTLATVDHDLVSALSDLADLVDAPFEPAVRQARSRAEPPIGPLTAEAIGHSLRVLLPENAILVDESITMASTLFEQTQGAKAHDYLYGLCGVAIGGGLPLALGASIACPSRRTVVLQGDGSAMQTNQALWSMAREKAGVVVILLKNDGYGILNIELARVCDGDPNDKMLSMTNISNPKIDWVRIAEAQGVPASHAETAEELHEQLEMALASEGPCLIEAQVAQEAAVRLVRK
jgi:acetolactate synthase-1/2/3 large subunit